MAVRASRSIILLVEDDANVAALLTEKLETSGYSVFWATTSAEAEALADQVAPDLVILDLLLPDTHGLVLCANLHEKAGIPIIVCSGTTRKEDAVISLKLGADDFIAKPFSADELLARVERRLQGAPQSAGLPRGDNHVQRVGRLLLDQARCTVTLEGQPVRLTPTEYRLLCVLANHAEQVLSRKDLAEQVWGSYDIGIIRSLGVHMRRLRSKLSTDGHSSPLVTVRGFGYRLTEGLSHQGHVRGA